MEPYKPVKKDKDFFPSDINSSMSESFASLPCNSPLGKGRALVSGNDRKF